MLYYNRTDVSEGIDPAKSNNSKKCIVYYFWFFNHEFKYRGFVFNDCHDLLMQCVSISDIAISTIKVLDYFGSFMTLKIWLN